MDQSAIYVEQLPKHLTYGQIKDTFCPYQRNAPILILKKEKYLLITFQKEETVKQILRDRDNIRLQGKKVTIKEAFKQFVPHYIHLPPSFHLPPEVVFPLPPTPPPPVILTQPFFISAPPPPAPTPPLAPYQHPFPEGFSYFFYK